MSKHYKSVELMGNRIFHKYWDGNKSVLEVTDSFEIELFVKGSTADSTSIYGESLSRVQFSKISDARNFMNDYKDVMDVFGQTSLEYQFIAKNYPGILDFNISNFNICDLDIETKFDNLGFPHPSKAQHDITAITCKFFGKPGFITFGVKPYLKMKPEDEYVHCKDEFDMLTKFISWWTKADVDIITGWNVIGFDIPYLVNRITNVLGESLAVKLSPFHNQTKKVFREKTINGGNKSYSILGISVLDYLELYKKFAREKQESYRLDNIAEVELDEGKLDYSEFSDLMDMYAKDPQKYIEYNIHDVRLVEMLDMKLQFMFLAITMGFMGKVNPDNIFGPVKLWDNIVYNELLLQGIQIPPAPEQGEDNGIIGAYVIKISPGAYKWVISFDLTSLYPSILMALNMSPETLVQEAVDGFKKTSLLNSIISHNYDSSHAVRNNVTFAANGSQYSRTKVGVLAQVTAKLFENRVIYKKKMLAVEREIEELKNAKDKNLAELHQKQNQRSHYDAMQQAFKIALNSLYGATGCPYFRYFNTNIAEGITLTGQYVSRRIGARVNDFLNEKFYTTGEDYLIAGDTDSIYLDFNTLVEKVIPPNTPTDKIVDFLDKFVKKYVDPFIAGEFKKMAEYLNFIKDTLSMKREAIADKVIWRGKKNYILQVYDNEGVRYTKPKIKVAGLESVRSAVPKLARKALVSSYNILLNGTESDLISFVSKFKSEFMSADITSVAFPRGVNDIGKWVDGSSWKIGTPIHVKAAISYNKLLVKNRLDKKFPLIKDGDKIRFVYLREPNPLHTNAIAFVERLHPEFGIDDYVDRRQQYEKTFKHPLESVARLVGYDVEYIPRITGFFTDEDAVNTAEVPGWTASQPATAPIVKPKVEDRPVNTRVPVAKKKKPKQAILTAFFE